MIFRHPVSVARSHEDGAAPLRRPRRSKSSSDGESESEAESEPSSDPAPSSALAASADAQPVRRGRGRPRKNPTPALASQPAVTGEEMTHPHTQGAAIEAAVNPSLELVEGGLQAAAAYDEADSESEDARIQAQYDNGTEYGDSGDDGEGYAEGQEEHEEGYVDSNGTFQLASNQVLLTLSYSLVSHVRQVARMEGVTAEDILLELIAEGVTKRAFQDFSRPTPSHFMTRTGYVPPEANGNVISQPTMSHHTMGNGQGQGRRNFNGNGNNRGGSPNGNYFPNRNGNGNGNGGGNRSFSGNGSYNGNGSGNYSGNGGGNRGNQNGGPQKNGNFRAGNQGGHQNGNQGGGQKNFKQNFQRNKNGNQGQQGGGNQSNQGNRGGQQNQHQGQGNQGQGNQSQGSHLHSDRANPNSSRDDE